MLNEEQKMLYRGAVHLLTADDIVQYYVKKYPKRNINRVAHRGLAAACRKFDPANGYSFLEYAKIYIHHYIRHYEFNVIPPEEKDPYTRFHHELQRNGKRKKTSLITRLRRVRFLYDLLKIHPEFADNYNWDKLDGCDWALILAELPQLSDRCPWDKLSGSDWSRLLAEQPQFADKCPWEKLDGYSWCRLLKKQPRFANKCQWEKLNGCSWDLLLDDQPQFADKRPTETPDVSEK